MFRSLFSGSDNIVKTTYIGCLVCGVLQIPLVLAFTIKHNKKTSKINPVVPRTLQFHEDEHDCDAMSNDGNDKTTRSNKDERDCDAFGDDGNDETTENDGHQIVTCVEVYDYGESIYKADENSVKSDENCEYLELSVSNVKLTEIREASGQLPGKVCHM